MALQPKITPQPQKTFFFERKDGSIFATQEVEADTIVRQNKFVLIGVSNGLEFARKISGVQKEVVRMQNEMIDVPYPTPENPNQTVKRPRYGEEEIEKYRVEAMRKAEQEEIELAKGHIEQPRDFTKTDVAGNPIKLGL